jgi:hypothetical protein
MVIFAFIASPAGGFFTCKEHPGNACYSAANRAGRFQSGME